MDYTALRPMSGAGSHGAPFFLEGVIVCWRFADLLEVTLGENLAHFDDLVVVTSHEDRQTAAVCRRHSVRCVPTDAIRGRWRDAFNKGAAINIGLDTSRTAAGCCTSTPTLCCRTASARCWPRSGWSPSACMERTAST